MIAIQTKQLNKTYGETPVVNDINLQVKQGTLLSLLGVNGAGKTTTIKLLTTLLRPTHGDATLLGYSIQNDSHKIKEIINISPQETAIASRLTVKENLCFICGIYDMNKKSISNKVQHILSLFHLEEIQSKKAYTLSGGWQRRLSIAMALISEPKILFLDEPTLGLDVIARRELWEIIRKLKQQTTIILTTHYLEEAQYLSDEVAIMSNGKLIIQDTPESLKEKAKTSSFEDAFLYFSMGDAS